MQAHFPGFKSESLDEGAGRANPPLRCTELVAAVPEAAPGLNAEPPALTNEPAGVGGEDSRERHHASRVTKTYMFTVGRFEGAGAHEWALTSVQAGASVRPEGGDNAPAQGGLGPGG